MKTIIGLSAMAFFLGAFPASETSARTWYILPDGTGDAPTIQAGVDSASVGDIVEVACGTYYDCTHLIDPEHTDTRACVIMKSGITLRSETGEADCVTLDAQGDQFGFGRIGISCWDVDDTAVIEGFQIINGLTYGSYGGGIHCEYSSPTVKQCYFSDNRAGGNATFAGGGGMKCVDYTGAPTAGPTIIDCVFSENESDSGEGGGLCIWSSCTVIRCNFIGNTAWYGGGVSVMFYGDMEVTLQNCLFVGNQAAVDGYGGGISVGHGSVSLSDCTIADNEAGSGGGIFVGPYDGASLTAFNTDILNNTSPVGSDGYVSPGNATFLTCCDVDVANWVVEEGGTLILVNEGCGVAVEAKTWGDVKALYR